MKKATIKSYVFSSTGIETLGTDRQEIDWPVVYQIYDTKSLYVGETTNLKARMSQHIMNPEKQSLAKFSVVFDETYNKSVALDLESQLIQWFGADGKYELLNKNDGLINRNYFDRQNYREQFNEIWEELRELKVADKSVKDIENSGLFKFSPYKRLNEDQLRVVEAVMMDIDEAFLQDTKSISIVGGNEGTGKTIVLMYLIKLIRDIQDYNPEDIDHLEGDSEFGLYFNQTFRDRLKDKSIAIVVPSQSLKGSILKIFKTISNLRDKVDVLSPIDFGSSDKLYDITFVDEAHLMKKSNQEVHKKNREQVDLINRTLFNDGQDHTELDWIVRKSKAIVMVYGDQRVRPNNISKEDLGRYTFREHILKSQMRSRGGEEYISYLRKILSPEPPTSKHTFEEFEFKLFESFTAFVDAIHRKEQEFGLARLVAGFAWDWKSSKDKSKNDIEIEGIGLRWNSVLNDWVGSPKSTHEVGSIYTIQGYDLNYCGVIIGNDLAFDPEQQKFILIRRNYYDRGAKKRSKQQIENNIPLTDADLLDQVIRTYRILMNRSIKGTYVYVCDRHLREYLTKFIDLAD